jgi:hypothetical protein
MMKRTATRVRWHKSVVGPEETRFLADLKLAAPIAELAPAQENARALLLRVGIPVIDEAKTAKEYAIGLLQIAAEVEQALMVQYLYAAASAVTAGVNSEIHRGKLARIAVQEMGHLATVQNLLLLVGGRDALHLQRDQLRKQSDENPIPFVLEPVSRPALATYVAAEMPATVPAKLQAKVDELVALANSKAHVALHRVGAIYAVLRWIFTPAAEAEAWMDLAALAPMPANPHLTDADLTPEAEVARYEADPFEWQAFFGGMIVEMPHKASEAVHAIGLVSEQGEGFGDAVDTHFEHFLAMVDDFDAGKLTARPLARSPNLGTGSGGEDGEVISHPYTKLWGEVFARQYGLLVLSIYHALRTPRDAGAPAELRSGLAGLALEGMKSVIRPLTGVLAALPLRPGDAGKIGNPAQPAGPPFDLDPALLLPPTSDAEIAARHLDELDRLADAYLAIENAADFADYPDDVSTLQDLRDYDQKRRDLIQA